MAVEEEYDRYIQTGTGEEWGYNRGEFQDEFASSIFGGVTTGAASGASFGPWGAVIGGAAGLFAGIAQGLQTRGAILEARERQKELDEEIASIDVLADFMTASGAASAKSRTEAKATASEQAARSGLVGGEAADLVRQREADIDTTAMQGIAAAIGPATQATTLMREEALRRHAVQQQLMDDAIAERGVLDAFGGLAGSVATMQQLGVFDELGKDDVDFKALGESAQGKAYQSGTAKGFTGGGLEGNEMPGPVDLSGGSDTLAGRLGYALPPPSAAPPAGEIQNMSGEGSDPWNYRRTMGDTGWTYETRKGNEGNWLKLPQGAEGEVSGRMDSLYPHQTSPVTSTAPTQTPNWGDRGTPIVRYAGTTDLTTHAPTGWRPPDPLMQGLAGDYASSVSGPMLRQREASAVAFTPPGLGQHGIGEGTSITQENPWGRGSNLGLYNEEYFKQLRGAF